MCQSLFNSLKNYTHRHFHQQCLSLSKGVNGAFSNFAAGARFPTGTLPLPRRQVFQAKAVKINTTIRN